MPAIVAEQQETFPSSAVICMLFVTCLGCRCVSSTSSPQMTSIVARVEAKRGSGHMRGQADNTLACYTVSLSNIPTVLSYIQMER